MTQNGVYFTLPLLSFPFLLLAVGFGSNSVPPFTSTSSSLPMGLYSSTEGRMDVLIKRNMIFVAINLVHLVAFGSYLFGQRATCKAWYADCQLLIICKKIICEGKRSRTYAPRTI